MLIRKILRKDNADVAGIIRKVMTEFGAVGEGYSIEDPEVDSMFESYDSDRARFYVVEAEQTVVGCGGIGPLEGAGLETCELKKMYFLPEARGRGIGRLLANTLIQDATRCGYRTIYIETLQRMEAAVRLYRKLGFEPLDARLGDTGHCGCDAYFALDIEPLEVDPSLLR